MINLIDEKITFVQLQK